MLDYGYSDNFSKIIACGAGRDEIVQGDGNNILDNGSLSTVIFNNELNDQHTFINYDEDHHTPG